MSLPLELISAQRSRTAGPYVQGVLGLVLLTAAALKTYQLLSGSDALIAGLLFHGIARMAMIEAEFILGLWLIFGRASYRRFMAAFVLFSLLTAVAVYESLRSQPSCGCFGNIKIPPRLTVAVDITSALALWFTRPGKASAVGHPVLGKHRTLVIAGASAVAIMPWTGYLMRERNLIFDFNGSVVSMRDLVVLDPASWLNKPFALLDDISGGGELRHGRWLVLLYHYDCDTCRQAIPAYSSVAQNGHGGPTTRIAFVAMPPIAAPIDNPVPASSAYLQLTLRADHDWVATTPMVIAIEEGKVVYAAEGEQATRPPRIPHWQPGGSR